MSCTLPQSCGQSGIMIPLHPSPAGAPNTHTAVTRCFVLARSRSHDAWHVEARMLSMCSPQGSLPSSLRSAVTSMLGHLARDAKARSNGEWPCSRMCSLVFRSRPRLVGAAGAGVRGVRGGAQASLEATGLGVPDKPCCPRASRGFNVERLLSANQQCSPTTRPLMEHSKWRSQHIFVQERPQEK